MWIPSSPARSAVILALAFAACSGRKTAARRAPAEILDSALGPATLAAELRKLGGGHVHAVATFRVSLSGAAKPADGSKPASPEQVSTTTDLWMDRKGDFRLLEVNDQDGGREVVRVGGEVAVALRYGKMVRRAAQDSESARHLREALGAPWAAWEIVRTQVEVEGGPDDYRLRFGARRADLPPVFAPAEGLRKWRDSVAVKTLEGQVSLERGGVALRSFTCNASYQAVRDGVAIEGAVSVSMTIDEVGKTAAVALPPSEAVKTRQRTVLEEKALLGGVTASAAWGNKKD
jgi:hypothetical protein